MTSIERKRTASFSEPESPAKKINQSGSKNSQEPLDSLSVDGPLTQEDVVYFQKEAIYRQMVAHRKEKDRLEAVLQTVEASLQSCMKCSHTLDEWWSGVIRKLDGLLRPAGAEAAGRAVGIDVAALGSAPLVFQPDEEAEAEFLKVLEAKQAQITDFFTRLFAAQSPPVAAPLSELQKSFDQLNSDFSALQIEKRTLEDRVALLDSQLADAQFRIQALQREKDRAASRTLARVFRAETAPESPQASEPAVAEPEKTAGSAADAAEAAELRALIGKYREQLEAQEAALEAERNSASELRLKLAHPRPQDVAELPYVRELKASVAQLAEALQQAETDKTRLAELNATLETNREEFKATLVAECDRKISDLNKRLIEADANYARVRNHRNELETQLKQLQSKLKGEAVLTEALTYQKVQAEQIEALEAQLAELRRGAAESNGSGSGTDKEGTEKGTSDQPTDLEQCREQLAASHKARQRLETELHSLEKAYMKLKQYAASVGDVDRARQVEQLTAEKDKNWAKYYAAMRQLDQNKELVKNLNKQATVAAEYGKVLKEKHELEEKKVKTLQAEIGKLRQVHERSEVEARALRERAERDKEQFVSLRSAIAHLRTEIETLHRQAKEEATHKRELEIELEKSRHSLKVSKTGFAADGSVDEAQVDALRLIAMCSLCSKNWKDTALKVCGHVFCSECIRERLAARQRRCPSCNKQFSHNDVMTVHL